MAFVISPGFRVLTTSRKIQIRHPFTGGKPRCVGVLVAVVVPSCVGGTIKAVLQTELLVELCRRHRVSGREEGVEHTALRISW